MYEKELHDFMAVYPVILHDLTTTAENYNNKAAAIWYKKALQYNLSLSNAKNGLLVVLFYKSFLNNNEFTEKGLRLAHTLGWCIELLHCVFLITDDITDNSTTRRGELCWYKTDGVGVNAINDAFIIENGIYVLLSKYFRQLDCYAELLELFHQSTFNCFNGQSADMLACRKSVSTFDMETYKALVTNKTSCHFFTLPIAGALHLAGITENQKQIFSECEAIAFELGHLGQVQNDYLDCFGDPTLTGKIGTDIEANKCTWLAVKCLELASMDQQAIMVECYGQNDAEKILRVKELYKVLDLPSIYTQFEEEAIGRIKKLIQQSSSAVPRDVFSEILTQLSRREIK